MSVTEVTEVTEGTGQDQHGDTETRRKWDFLADTIHYLTGHPAPYADL